MGKLFKKIIKLFKPKYKVGDEVIKIDYSAYEDNIFYFYNHTMKYGETGTVRKYDRWNKIVYLNEYRGPHRDFTLKTVFTTWKERYKK